MTNLHRRLKKLEASLTDATGLVPDSPAWTARWTREIERTIAEPDYCPVPRIPLDAFRACLQAQPDSA